jgi:diketogulonate reductase-like aldo/keto reductase
MAHLDNITLNNGVELPPLGFGVFQTPPEETRSAVAAALDTGYRHIDTAAAYGNEREVGDAVAASAAGRAGVLLETKIWISDYGYQQTLHGFDKSAGKLGVDQIDLLILHQPLPTSFDRTLEAYRALEHSSRTARCTPSASATSWSTTSPSCWRRPTSSRP